MARRSLKPGAMHSPLPAVMVTVGDMETSNIITVAWTGILSTIPPRAYISVRPTRHSHAIICEKKEFVINLTTKELAYATDYSGVYTGAKVDKFEKLGLTKIASEAVSAPTIAESPLALECRVFDIVHSGSHDIFMADIVNVSCDESLLDENGRIRLDRAGLIAYAHGEYFELGKFVGKFGFSASKETKRRIASGKPPIKSQSGSSHRPPARTKADADKKRSNPAKGSAKGKNNEKGKQ